MTNKLFLIISVVLSLAFLFSCGKENSTDNDYSKVSFYSSSSSYLSSSSAQKKDLKALKAFHPSFPGGLAIWGEGGNLGETFSLLFNDQSNQESIILNNGEWVFPAVGWTAASLLGNVFCGVGQQFLQGKDTAVRIDISTQKCADSNFAPPEYLSPNDGQFKPLRIITCKNISSVSANGNCNGTNKGASASYKIQVPGYPVFKTNSISMPYTPVIESLCINATSITTLDSTTSDTSTLVKIPIGKTSTSRLGVRIKAYEHSNCTDSSPWMIDYDFPNGLINGSATGSSSAKVFAGTVNTDIFLAHNTVSPPGVAYKLSMAGTSLGQASSCLGPYTISVNDSIALFINVTANSTVTLSHSGTQDGYFYTTSDCSSAAITQTTIASGTSSINNIYFKKSTKDPNVVLTAAMAGLVSATLPLNVTGIATKLAVSGVTSGTTNTCIGPFTVKLKDSYDSDVTSANSISVHLTSTNGAFYWGTDTLCSSTTYTFINIAVNYSSFNFYYKYSGSASTVATIDATSDTLTGTSMTVQF
ncbi:MAG: hypothetical protein HQK51_07790 [Oligoflexia bacterium]|nr:hypothetical protein [Oligoflexia bacterium]